LPDARRKQQLLRTVPHLQPDFFHECIGGSRIYNEFFDAADLNAALGRHFQYKLEHLLRMEDRNSMAFSIEARVPYLDHRLIEYVLAVPEDLKIKSGEAKHLQKQAVGHYTVPEILKRTDKIGFGTPVDEWMSTPSRENLVTTAYRDLSETFPDIFRSESEVPSYGRERWKIKQLAVWKEVAEV